MKKMLLFLLLSLAFCGLEAQQNFYVVDSLYCYVYDSIATTPTERQYNLSFSPDGEALESRREQYLPWLGQWRNFANLTYVYDGQNNLVVQNEQQWDTLANAWVNFKNSDFTPNQNGDYTQVLNQQWDGFNWQNVDRINSIFSANGYIETLTQQLWENGNWRNNFRIIYATNAMGKVVLTKFQLWSTTTNMFYDVSRQSYFYDPQNPEREVRQIAEVYNQPAMRWDSSSQVLKSYDSEGNQTDEINEHWDTVDSIWVNTNRILQIYNAADEVTLRTELVWNGSQWVNYFQVNNVYDVDGNLTRYEVSQWQVNLWALLSSCDFYVRFHHEILAANEPLAAFCQLPNPYRLGQPIQCPALAGGWAKQLAVFDFSGKIVYAQNIENHAVIEINGDLPTGLYVVKISGEQGQVFSQKLLIVNGN